MRRLINDLNVPSASVAVAIDGKIIWAEAIGYSNIEKRIPANPQTVYRIGSTSKAVTASAMMIAVQENEVDLYKNVSEILEDYPKKKWGFNTAQLLSHTAGFPDYEDLRIRGLFYSLLNFKEFSTVEEGTKLFKNIPLLFEPGTDFKYNSFDIVLASRVLEVATNSSFTDYLQMKLFNPLNMKNTFLDSKNNQPANRAEFYEIDKSTSFRVWHTFGFPKPEQNLSYKWAGGGMLSTPTDLVKLGNALINDSTLFQKKVRDIFFTPQKLTNGQVNEQNYALGWRSNKEYKSKYFENDEPIWIVHHAGVSKGSMNFLCLFPESNVVIDVAINGRTNKANFSPFGDFVIQMVAPFIDNSGINPHKKD